MPSAAGDAIEETAAERRKRIADCLVDSDGASPPSPPETPRLRIPMFTCAKLRFVRLGMKRGGGGRKEAAVEKTEAASVDSPGCKEAESSNSSSSTETGMGLSLLFLLAKTCVELNKMAEVRAEMEALMMEMRDRVRTISTDHVVAPRTCDLQNASSCRTLEHTDVNGHATCSSAVETASSESGTRSEFEGPASVDGPRQFELRCCNTEQETSESSDGEFIELNGRFRASRDSEDGGGEEEHSAQDDGVSAVELERKLHELAHQRDRRRIEELESSLRRAERKLMEKEMEARLWKETASLALQRPPPQDGQ